MHALVGGRSLLHRQPRTPFFGRPDRPWHETATAVRANIVELVLDAIGTERALIAADPCIDRIRRKVPVAIFAVRPELQRHGLSRVRAPSSQISRRMRMTNNPRFEPSSLAVNGMNGASRIVLSTLPSIRRYQRWRIRGWRTASGK